MRLCNGLNHIGDQFSGSEAVVHAPVSHRDSVANSRDSEKKRPAPPRMDPFFNEPLKVTHTCVAGDDIRKARCNSYKRFVHLGARDSC